MVLVLSVIDTGSNYLLSLKVGQNSDFLNTSQNVIRNADNINRSMIGMQNSFRGYLLTEDSSFLQGYKNGLVTIPPLLAELRKLVLPNKEQVNLLDSIVTLHALWINYADALIASRKQSSASNQQYQSLFENQLKKKVGKKINDDIATKFDEFDKIEYSVRDIHRNNLNKSIDKTHIFSLTFFALTVLIGVATTYYVVSLISRRIKNMVRLADNISKGKFITVAETGNDELTALNTSLNSMSVSLRKNIGELQRRNEELDKFAYVVSHDLKAPIRGIHNVLQWIEEDLSNELSLQMSKYIAIISGRTRRMENLINGLLDYARIREKTKPESIDVNKLVAEIVEDIVPRTFTVELKDLPVIFGERIKIEQLFTNLISNAAKFTSPEKGKIVVSCKEYAGYYEFSVQDNGIGIDPEFHERIFEMFQTLREKGEKESTGIGLAIIKKIIDELKGSITVNSRPGEGAEFTFTLPRLNTSL